MSNIIRIDDEISIDLNKVNCIEFKLPDIESDYDYSLSIKFWMKDGRKIIEYYEDEDSRSILLDSLSGLTIKTL